MPLLLRIDRGPDTTSENSAAALLLDFIGKGDTQLLLGVCRRRTDDGGASAIVRGEAPVSFMQQFVFKFFARDMQTQAWTKRCLCNM